MEQQEPNDNTAKAERLIMALNSIGELVINLKEERDRLLGELSKAKERIERLEGERRLLKEKITALIEHIERIEESLLRREGI